MAEKAGQLCQVKVKHLSVSFLDFFFTFRVSEAKLINSLIVDQSLGCVPQYCMC